MNYKTCLIELNTEEIPAKQANNIHNQFYSNIISELKKNNITFSKIHFFGTPRRIAVIIKKLNIISTTETVKNRGPAIKYAFNAQGKPTKPTLKWMEKFNITLKKTKRIDNEQGSWLFYEYKKKKKSIKHILSNIITYTIQNISIKKTMLWNDNNIKFIRPIRNIIILLNKKFIPLKKCGLSNQKYLYGNIFTNFKKIKIQHAAEYENILYKEGKVIAKSHIRKKKIQYQAKKIVNMIKGKIHLCNNLLEEITYLTEWPKVLLGTFKKKFLDIPKEIIIYIMETIQKFIPIYYIHNNRCMNHFIIVANTKSKESDQIVVGNERVLHARLCDIAFFIKKDQTKALQDHFILLKNIIFHEKLGTMLEKSYRIIKLITYIAQYTKSNLKNSIRAAYLSKCDLNTYMVYEFPELKGIVGMYYSLKNGESKKVALSIKEQYKPKFSQDTLPSSILSCTLALSEKIDTIVGLFLINNIPTKDKDPFCLRRLTIGVIRIIIEKKIDLNLKNIIKHTIIIYNFIHMIEKYTTIIMKFFINRLYAWYKKKYNVNFINAILSCHTKNLLKIDLILNAFTKFQNNIHFKQLIITYKRIFNLLNKNKNHINKNIIINYKLIQNENEKMLFIITNNTSCILHILIKNKQYTQALKSLFIFNKLIENFLNQNSIKYTEKNIQNNRIILLLNIQKLFLIFADFIKL